MASKDVINREAVKWARDIPLCFWCGHSGEEHDEYDLGDFGHEVWNAAGTHAVGICSCYRYERPESDDYLRSRTPETYTPLTEDTE